VETASGRQRTVTFDGQNAEENDDGLPKSTTESTSSENEKTSEQKHSFATSNGDNATAENAAVGNERKRMKTMIKSSAPTTGCTLQQKTTEKSGERQRQ